jgi:molybdenum cofactor biosynthesis protein MoaC
MKDVSPKSNTLRTAKATSAVHCLPETILAVKTGNTPKSDPIGVARVAAIQAAKNTSLIIPYCHQVPLDFVGIDAELNDESVMFTTEVKAVWKTGVEMEALVAASAAALTFYDMLKPIDDSMQIGPTLLLEKKGGKSDFNDRDLAGLRAGVIVLSDSTSQGHRTDVSGKSIKARLEQMNVEVVAYVVLPDEQRSLEAKLIALCDQENLNVIITTGGTGLGPRDRTPEATLAAVERVIPGIGEFLRSHGQERTRYAMLGRGIAGVRGKTIIVNLPGSPRGVDDSMDVLFPWLFHARKMLDGGGH